MKKFILVWALMVIWLQPAHSFAQETTEIHGAWTNHLGEKIDSHKMDSGKVTVRALMKITPDEDLEELITALENALLQRKTAFTIDYSGDLTNLDGKIQDVIKIILQNNEYLSYDFRAYSYSGRGTSEKFTISFSVKYYQTAEQDSYVDQRITQILEHIINKNMNIHEKVKAVHDYIILNVTYDTTYNQNVNAPYFALTEGKTLCNGYAMLMYKMLEQLDIPVRLISGNAGGIGHAWNLVQLDGKWYHLDATWDDPVPDEEGRTVYNYYLVPDEMINNDHDWQSGGLNGNDQPYPIADTDYADELSSIGYDELAESLDLHILYPQFTSRTDEEFVNLVASHFNKMDEEFSIRFLTNNTSYLGDLIYEAASKSAVTSWHYTWNEYPRTEETDYIVTITNINYINKKEEIAYPIDGYKPFDEKNNVDPKKEWTIKFNTDIDSNINESDVYVVNRFGEKLINYITLEDSKTLKVFPPNGGYALGETYYLVVEHTILSTKGKHLKEAVTLKFTISN